MSALFLSVCLAVVGEVVGGGGLPLLVGLAVLLPPATTLSIRRLHDTGHTGAWYLTSLVPGLGTALALFLLFASSGSGVNRWGAPEL